VIFLNKLINFRCIGGVQGHDGRLVKTGLLLRAGQLFQLDEESVKRLADYKIDVIVDLRTAPEILRAPNDEIAGARSVSIDILEAGTEHFVNRDQWIRALNPKQAVDGMNLVYAAFVKDETAKLALSRFLHTLLEAEGAVLFHCYAGKDRTGFAAALLLRILGVNMDCIMHDYLLTVEERKEHNKAQFEQYRQKGLSEEQLAGLAIAYSVLPQFLEYAFEQIDESYGSFENFIKKGLGIDQDLVEKLRDKYLE